jgi:pterin-4a-carbinolamine dehydratase
VDKGTRNIAVNAGSATATVSNLILKQPGGEKVMNQTWQLRNRPARLEGRYEFDSYENLRDFLDRAADLSEREGLYPDMGFGKDYVNITIHADDGESELAEHQKRFAEQLDALSSDKLNAKLNA